MARVTLGAQQGVDACRKALAEPLSAPESTQCLPRVRPPLRHHSSLGGCSWPEAGEVELELASQTLDALGLQSHDFIQLGHKFFKIIRIHLGH